MFAVSTTDTGVPLKIATPDFSAYNTTFQYELDDLGRGIAEFGLDDLENSLPYTLIFINKIKSVEIG